jgi:PAS domain S-box-containing protein
MSLPRPLIALFAPLVAFVLELLLWELIRPHVWFLFYPAVFISAAVGGRRLGLIATALSTFLVWWFFLPPRHSLNIEPRHLFAIVVFCATGVAFAFFHERLTRAIKAESAKQQLEIDLREMTELDRKLKQLVDERRVFAALVESSSDFIGIADADGRPSYVNPAGRRMVGLSAEHPAEDTRIEEYYTPDQRSFAAQVIVETMREEGHWEGETYFRNWRTEQAIPVSGTNFMVRDPETSQLLGMATITRDISELRKAQAELQRTNQELVAAHAFLEDLLESSTEYSMIAEDLDRRVLAWNKGAARIYGYEASEVVGESSDMLHVPEELQSGAVDALHRRALEDGRATGLFRRLRKDGTEFIARAVITRRNDANGNAVGYLLVSHDVTDEQRVLGRQQFLAEVGAALQASLDYAATIERIVKLAVDFVGEGCAIDVLEDVVTLRRMRVVHADPSKAGLAKALEQILPERNHPIWRVLEQGQPLLFREVTADVLRSVAKNDEHLALLESLGTKSAIFVPLVLRDRIIAVLTLVSCRSSRRYDGEDVHLAEELARRASLALDNARLYEVAQNAIHARDQVLGVVAHDLRNPLGTVLTATSLLRPRDGEPERRSRRPVDSIERAANRMNRLIQDLLEVTRIEAGSLAIEAARVSAKRAVSEAVETQRALAAAASLELQIELQPDLPRVWADRDRLLQIFENLIGNAVKFTKPPGRILVGAASRGKELLFWVKDTGPGIDAAHLPHVFERFWQAEKARRRGAGLGLPIVKGIVEAHGGRIWVESTPGLGSTFYFTIPTAAPAEKQPGRSFGSA